MRNFEQPDNLLPNTFVVVRIDGRGFTKYDSPSELQLHLFSCTCTQVDLPSLLGFLRGLAAYTVGEQVFQEASGDYPAYADMLATADLPPNTTSSSPMTAARWT